MNLFHVPQELKVNSITKPQAPFISPSAPTELLCICIRTYDGIPIPLLDILLISLIHQHQQLPNQTNLGIKIMIVCTETLIKVSNNYLIKQISMLTTLAFASTLALF